MIKLLIRVVINAVAIWVAAYIVPGITVSGGIAEWLILAIIFGLVNAFIRPVIRLLTLPISIVTLGLFSLVINALMLMLVGWLSKSLTIDGALFGFFNALLGSIIISIVSTVLSWFVSDD
jgi:putative membrane protein